MVGLLLFLIVHNYYQGLPVDCKTYIQPNIMAQHNVIYIEAWYARDISLGLACTRHEVILAYISLATQV